MVGRGQPWKREFEYMDNISYCRYSYFGEGSKDVFEMKLDMLDLAVELGKRPKESNPMRRDLASVRSSRWT